MGQYAGGGRQVIRCELSLDCGKTWRLADIRCHEEPTVYGKYWCWVFWELKVPTVDILRAPELRCRAVDSSNNSQPEGWVLQVLLGSSGVTRGFWDESTIDH